MVLCFPLRGLASVYLYVLKAVSHSEPIHCVYVLRLWLFWRLLTAALSSIVAGCPIQTIRFLSASALFRYSKCQDVYCNRTELHFYRKLLYLKRKLRRS